MPKIQLFNHKIDGYKIRQRSKDDFVNLSDLCKTGKKNVADYFRTTEAFEYVKALNERLGFSIISIGDDSLSMRVSASENKDGKSRDSLSMRVSGYSATDCAKMFPNLIESKRGSSEFGGGTYAHPEIAMDCAQWVSTECRMWANQTLVRYLEADVTLIGDIGERSTDVEGLKQEVGRLRDRIQFLEGRDYRVTAGGKSSLLLVTQWWKGGLDSADSSYAKVLHIALNEMSDEELISAGMSPVDIFEKNLADPEKIDAIADYLGLIKNGWIDQLYKIRRHKVEAERGYLADKVEDMTFLRTRAIAKN